MKYRLLAEHIAPVSGEVLPAGTEVGDDTPYPWKNADGSDAEPSTTMEGLDDAARKKVEEVHQRLFGHRPYWHEGQPDEVRKAREKEAEEQQKLDEGSEPVSEQQRVEREYADEQQESELAKRRPKGEPMPMIPPRGAPVAMPGPARQPSSTANPNPTRGGVTTPAPGPATPKPPDKEEVRPKNPNEQQYPKG